MRCPMPDDIRQKEQKMEKKVNNKTKVLLIDHTNFCTKTVMNDGL